MTAFLALMALLMMVGGIAGMILGYCRASVATLACGIAAVIGSLVVAVCAGVWAT